jgi:Flp pilus assembly protein TadD
MANFEKGDAQAAEQVLTRAAAASASDADVLYALAEMKRAKNETNEAVGLYKKAAAADTSWGKPLYRLGTIAMTSGDKDTARSALSQVVAVDPTSPEAAQAKTALEQLGR